MFVAHPSRWKALAALLLIGGIAIVGTVGLVLPADAPWWARLWGLGIVVPLALWCVQLSRQAFTDRPLIEADAEGIVWHRWSPQRIPWSAVKGWQDRHYINTRQFSLWLKDPAKYPATTINRWLGIGNRWLGFGHVTFSAAGTDRTDAELREVLKLYLGPATPPGLRGRMPG